MSSSGSPIKAGFRLPKRMPRVWQRHPALDTRCLSTCWQPGARGAGILGLLILDEALEAESRQAYSGIGDVRAVSQRVNLENEVVDIVRASARGWK